MSLVIGTNLPPAGKTGATALPLLRSLILAAFQCLLVFMNLNPR